MTRIYVHCELMLVKNVLFPLLNNSNKKKMVAKASTIEMLFTAKWAFMVKQLRSILFGFNKDCPFSFLLINQLNCEEFDVLLFFKRFHLVVIRIFLKFIEIINVDFFFQFFPFLSLSLLHTLLQLI